ncbi:MAG: MCE family protein [Pseudonocardia sp.]|nr:MCE family protein [Pseudonocardia sp.]
MVDRLEAWPRRILGLGMIALVVALLGVCVVVYNHVFTDRVMVTVHIDQVDDAFLPNEEVRLRGVTVGEVSRAVSQGQQAVLTLALQPSAVPNIPRNVTVRLVPKSLFGERYVSLNVPAQQSAELIQPGDVIPRDRSADTIELGKVFADTLPLLQAVNPADLASTLGAVDQTLTGRGAKLGQTLRQLHTYVSQLNLALPDLTADIRALPPFTDTYAKAAPNLIQALANLTTTSRTLVEKQSELANLLSSATTASDDLYYFVQRNRDNLPDLVHVARPPLELLARYSPEYVCFFRQLADGVTRISPVFGTRAHPTLTITLEIVPARAKYLPHADEPDFTDNRGPACYPQPVPAPQYPGGKPFQDGSTHQPAAKSSAPSRQAVQPP